MHTSQTSLLTASSQRMPTHNEGMAVESLSERQRKMAIAAGNELKVAHASHHPGATEQTSNSLRLRSNLLHKLGIRDEKAQVHIRQPSKGLLGDVPVSKEPLKYDSDEDEQQDAAPSWQERLFFKPSSLESKDTAASSLSSVASAERKLTFNETVSVVPIPMRHDYSHRVRERLWNDVNDIMLNAQRNALEFAAEGWDWRTVTEDEYMYRDAATGDLIHPVHMETHYD